MAFKLSEQLDDIGNPNLPFELYNSYLEHNKHKFPQSALNAMELENWTGGSSSNSPYNSDLQQIELLNYQSRGSGLTIYIMSNVRPDPEGSMPLYT